MPFMTDLYKVVKSGIFFLLCTILYFFCKTSQSAVKNQLNILDMTVDCFVVVLCLRYFSFNLLVLRVMHLKISELSPCHCQIILLIILLKYHYYANMYCALLL